MKTIRIFQDEDTYSLQPGGYCIVKVFGKTACSFRLHDANILRKIIRAVKAPPVNEIYGNRRRVIH